MDAQELNRYKKQMVKAGLISTLAAMAVMGCLQGAGMGGAVRWASFAFGVLVSWIALYCLYRVLGAVPDKTACIVWYLLRLAAEFGAVLAALFLPFADALGVLIPQLFPILVLAVLMAVGKK